MRKRGLKYSKELRLLPTRAEPPLLRRACPTLRLPLSRFLPRSFAPGGLNVIRKEAWLFYRTSFGVRLCWELEEPKGPTGSHCEATPACCDPASCAGSPRVKRAATPSEAGLQGYLAHKKTPSPRTARFLMFEVPLYALGVFLCSRYPCTPWPMALKRS